MSRPTRAAHDQEGLEALLDSLPDGAAVLDDRGIVVHANAAAEGLLADGGGTLVGRALPLPLVDADRGEIELSAASGERRVLELQLSPLRWGGEPRVLASLRDVTSRRVAEEALARQAAEVQALHRIAATCLAATTEEEAYGPCLEEISRATGYEAVLLHRLDAPGGRLTLVHGRTGTATLASEQVAWQGSMAGQVLRTSAPVVVPDVVLVHDPWARALQELGIRTCVGVVVPGVRRPWGVLTIGSDDVVAPHEHLVELVETLAAALASFIERVRARTALSASEARFRRLAEHAPDVLFRHGVGDNGRFEYVSPSCEVLLGYTPDELCQSTWDLTRLVLPDERAAVATLLAGPPGPSTLSLRWARRDGTVVPVELRCVPATDAQGHVVAIEGIARDVSERVAFEVELAARALHDPLTGLANRALFHEHVTQVLARRDGPRSAVLFVDLDGFKAVNDTVGHEAGDDLLREIADRLRRSVRPADTVARMGGDEFAVLCEELHDEDGALVVATRIVDDARRPVTLAGRQVAVGASVGVAMVEAGLSADDVLRRADLAMYRAKTVGRDQAVLFDRAMATAVELMLGHRRDLRRALAHDELELRYAPQVDLHTNEVVALEALLQWRHPDEGTLAAAAFVAAADHPPLAHALTGWVLDHALADAAAWVQAGGEASVVLSLNVSAGQFRHPDLVDQVAAALTRHGLEPQHLCLEIGEEALGLRHEHALRRLAQLRDLGVLLALDDYGTGASSLRLFRDLPVHQLKVDASFMTGLGVDAADTALVRAVVDLGRDLWLPVVALGVTTASQRQVLLSFGCPRAQGPLFSAPIGPADVPAMLASGRLDPAVGAAGDPPAT